MYFISSSAEDVKGNLFVLQIHQIAPPPTSTCCERVEWTGIVSSFHPLCLFCERNVKLHRNNGMDKILLSSLPGLKDTQKALLRKGLLLTLQIFILYSDIYQEI